MKKKLTLKKRILYLGITLLIMFLLLEGLMIILEPYLFSGFFMYDPDLGFRVRPGERATNRFGFLDHDYPLERKPGTFRMLILGDSYGWTGGIHWNYTAIFERACRDLLGDDRVEVINTGYPMTHTGEQLAILKKFGLQYQPDLVVLGFFTGNDFIDALPYRKRIVLNDTYVDIDPRYEWRIFGYPIVFQSRLYLYLKQKYILFKEFARARKEAKAGNPAGNEIKGSVFPFGSMLLSLIRPQATQDLLPKRAPDPSTPLYSEETFLQLEKDRLDFCNIASQEVGLFDDRIQYIRDSITQMKELLDQSRIQFVVAIYPDEFQVNDALLEKVLTRYDLKREDYEITCMQRILKEHLDSLNIPWIDMLEDFRERAKTTSLFLPGDSHWNNAGNDLAASLLLRDLPDLVKWE